MEFMSEGSEKNRGDARAESGSKKAPGSVAETCKTLIWALVIAFTCRIFFFEPFSIPSGSMKPTLLVGDYLFVSKLAYGYGQYSFPFAPVSFDGRLMEDRPERGDVAVFRPPHQTDTDFIKRVIGLPGDEIQIVRGILHVNGAPVTRRRIEDFRTESGQSLRQYVETLPNELEHFILEESDHWPNSDDTRVYTVPEDQYFMMGDNRDHSRDSRFPGVGFVPIENFIGPATIIFFSIDDSASWYQPWTWPFAIRYGRLLQSVE